MRRFAGEIAPVLSNRHAAAEAAGPFRPTLPLKTIVRDASSIGRSSLRCLASGLGFALAVAAGLGPARAADDLGALRWKARPLVVFAGPGDDRRAGDQLAALDRARAGLRERDVRVIRDARETLRRRLGVPAGAFAVVLVGKDGGVKEVWRDLVDPRLVFKAIDAMPMRQNEAKQRG